MIEENEFVELELGKTVGKKWKVMNKIDEGNCGVIYLVQDTKTKAEAAMKVEPSNLIGGSVLKMEAQILKRMQGRKFVAQLLSSGKKKERYSYMVMTLFGASLSQLFMQCKEEFTVSTQIRLGIQILYSLKQLHEVGYVHRDVKPANFVVGRKGSEARMLHLLDFGMARRYVTHNKRKAAEIRKPRENALFRGTMKYCSANTHTQNEQGRPDDLWSMLYMLAEMRKELPWSHFIDAYKIGKLKNATTDEELLVKCPPQMLLIAKHLRTLDYFKRPDYQLIFDILFKLMEELNVKYSDPFDWEVADVSTIQNLPCVLAVSEDNVTAVEDDKNQNKDLGSEQLNDNAFPFNVEDFSRNELGF
ncbi:putative serine/threonine-protein kinase K06H7.1 [Aphelenchoides bicaudatus]|nr:putative serine/threonine-protein kinase K06H7.1 [Aphelenchoides bicaudatus]